MLVIGIRHSLVALLTDPELEQDKNVGEAQPQGGDSGAKVKREHLVWLDGGTLGRLQIHI